MSTEKNSVKNFWNDLPAWVKLIVIIVLIFIIIALIKYFYSLYKKKKEQELLEGGTTTIQTTGTNNQPLIVTVDLGTKASAINSAFYSNDWFGFSEDEQAAKTELLGVPKELIPELSSIYFKLNGKNLKQDFQKFLSTEDWQSVSYLFN